tara:strand:- start:72 stop:809 length:738 start_codon:yes stop_codon:yes gene_type:complete
MNKSSTFELWRGPSLIDGKPTVVLASGFDRPSHNGKTGVMIQVYILRADMPPQEAVNTGQDVSVCGDCKMRRFLVKIARINGATDAVECYVIPWRDAGRVWQSMIDGNVPKITPHAAGLIARRLQRAIRLGTYGGPDAVPFDIWAQLLTAANGKHTAYTHRWEDTPELKRYAMASINAGDHAARLKAWAQGWRTYRVLAKGEQPLPGEIMCPEETQGVQCANCGLCNGHNGHLFSGLKNITISAI